MTAGTPILAGYGGGESTSIPTKYEAEIRGGGAAKVRPASVQVAE